MRLTSTTRASHRHSLLPAAACRGPWLLAAGHWQLLAAVAGRLCRQQLSSHKHTAPTCGVTLQVWEHLDATGDMLAVRLEGEIYYLDAADDVAGMAAGLPGEIVG